jgi:membrane fusion protein (multidrug efflux system)
MRPKTLIGCFCIGLLLTSCQKKPAEAPSPAAKGPDLLEVNPADVVEATEKPLLAGVRVTGTLNPAVRLDIKAQTSGQIEMIGVDRGSVVTQKQVVARLEDQGIKAQLDSTKAQLAAAERDFGASEVLFKAGAASERTYVNAKVNVESTKAQLAQAQQNMDRATVRSPINGVVSERAVSAGEVVNPGQKLLTVVNSDVLECAVSVMPADLMNIRIGQTAYLQAAAYGDVGVVGRVERIDPIADPKSRRVGVYIMIPNTNRALVSGLFSVGIIMTNDSPAMQKVLVLPTSAVLDEKGKAVVLAIEGERLTRRTVEVRANSGEEGLVEVRSGISPGTKVLLSPGAGLKEGTRVRILETPKTQ